MVSLSKRNIFPKIRQVGRAKWEQRKRDPPEPATSTDDTVGSVNLGISWVESGYIGE
jgi:hypothetical protein